MVFFFESDHNGFGSLESTEIHRISRTRDGYLLLPLSA
jgi:hypothetical protein